jgi:alkanesulfonate monooxygenase SsuD/methylene tetrahydromethanopterin reductase-like flavin-dependent oxidoreductase (luciferase family)
VSLDQLSHGRLVLPVGLGWPGDGAFSKVGEELDRKKRAQMLDESLEILKGLWSGEPFSYEGEHYHVQEMTFSPPPTQSPRIPIWVVGAWPRKKSIQRALRYDGILPRKMHEDGSFAEMTPADLEDLRLFIAEHRHDPTPFDLVMEGETPGNDLEKAVSLVQPLAQDGATWWLEAVWGTPETQGGVEGLRARIKQGPPHL